MNEEGWRWVGDIPWFASVLCISYSASTLLVGWQEGRPACKWTCASKYVSEWIYIGYCRQRTPNALDALVQITPNSSVLEQRGRRPGKSRLILVHLAVRRRQQWWWYTVVIVGLVRHWFLHSGQVSAGCSSVLHDAWPQQPGTQLIWPFYILLVWYSLYVFMFVRKWKHFKSKPVLLSIAIQADERHLVTLWIFHHLMADVWQWYDRLLMHRVSSSGHMARLVGLLGFNSTFNTN